MSQLACPNCGANLQAPQSIRIAEYHFGHLEGSPESLSDGPGFRYHREQPDTYSIVCTTCNRLVRTLPLN